jgi:hypothetical protein
LSGDKLTILDVLTEANTPKTSEESAWYHSTLIGLPFEKMRINLFFCSAT